MGNGEHLAKLAIRGIIKVIQGHTISFLEVHFDGGFPIFFSAINFYQAHLLVLSHIPWNGQFQLARIVNEPDRHGSCKIQFHTILSHGSCLWLIALPGSL